MDIIIYWEKASETWEASNGAAVCQTHASLKPCAACEIRKLH